MFSVRSFIAFAMASFTLSVATIPATAVDLNFAIKTSVAYSFLEANGPVTLAETATPRLASHEVANRGQAFTVLVVCR